MTQVAPMKIPYLRIYYSIIEPMASVLKGIASLLRFEDHLKTAENDRASVLKPFAHLANPGRSIAGVAS